MLGVRHYKNFAIDLWQGDVTLFSSDITCCIWLEAGKPLGSQSSQLILALNDEQRKEIHLQFDKSNHFTQKVTLGFTSNLFHTIDMDESFFPLLLKEVSNRSLRHVCIPALSKSHNLPKVMKSLKNAIEGEETSAPHRITFILPNLDEYNLYQEALFQEFTGQKKECSFNLSFVVFQNYRFPSNGHH